MHRPGKCDSAYLAGIIDGEGSIMMNHHRRNWSIIVTISNCDIKLMEWLLEKVGGSFTPIHYKNENYRVLYRWRVEGKTALPVLEAALPYLVLKKGQAVVAIQAIRTLQRGGRDGLPVSVVENRERWAAEIKEMNRRGA